MTTAEKYVTAAYLAVLVAVLAYIVIYAFKLQRLDRELRQLESERAGPHEAEAETDAAPAEAVRR